MNKNQQMFLATALGVSAGLNVSMFLIDRYKTRETQKALDKYSVIADIAIASFVKLREVDPEAANAIAYDAQFAFIMQDNDMKEKFDGRHAGDD